MNRAEGLKALPIYEYLTCASKNPLHTKDPVSLSLQLTLLEVCSFSRGLLAMLIRLDTSLDALTLRKRDTRKTRAPPKKDGINILTRFLTIMLITALRNSSGTVAKAEPDVPMMQD
jgi:hypothetical protein